jgi:hypothetical protein
MIEIGPELNPKNWSKVKKLIVFGCLFLLSFFRLLQLNTIGLILSKQADYTNWGGHAFWLFVLCYSIYMIVFDVIKNK